MKRLKGDNRGLSLIEVMVAVVILAIVVTPFLHSFVTTATTNSKAKTLHKATLIAQGVMEGFKAESLEDISMQFNYPDQGFYVLAEERIGTDRRGHLKVGEKHYNSVTGEYPDVSAYEDGAGTVTASTYSTDMGVTGEFLGQEDGVYYFYMENVKEDDTEYDVLVKLDASLYRAGGSVDADHQYNDETIVQLPVIDLDQDAMSVQRENYTDLAVQSFLASHTGVDGDTIRNGLGRTITITVDKTRVGVEDRITVMVEYLYTYQHMGDIWPYRKTHDAFDSMETEKDLRSVYLCYYPLYSAGASRDKIIFKNPSAVPLNFYLVKQMSSSAVLADEENYNLDLLLEEGVITEAEDMQTRMYTNLATNLVSGSEVVLPRYTVKLNGNSIDLADIPTGGTLTSGKKEDRIFDVAVSVYKSGAKAANFPEDMRLTTLEGSKVK